MERGPTCGRDPFACPSVGWPVDSFPGPQESHGVSLLYRNYGTRANTKESARASRSPALGDRGGHVIPHRLHLRTDDGDSSDGADDDEAANQAPLERFGSLFVLQNTPQRTERLHNPTLSSVQALSALGATGPACASL